jgi:2-polyprenyl-3-methyl-5-hydroxy-6-metoxy-1,4-benzoquinol methylase
MPLETLTKCPVCKSSTFSNYLNVEDYTVSHKEFTIQQCNDCYFLFTNPRPPVDEIGAYYQSENYISHHDGGSDIMSKIYNSVRNHTIKQKIALINELKKGKGSILDVGCGTGSFINACKEDGWEIAATEPDHDARSIAGSKLKRPVYGSINEPELQGERFDIISLWHVLEHIHDLNETVSWLKNHLADQGKLVIAVPNSQSYDAQQYRKFWAAYDVPRHLYHFTKSTMKTLMSRHELEVKQVLPMWFDSFYVSMLSTKYKNGSVSMLDTAKTGLLSNLKGKPGKDDTNTSSLIYIITKQ